MIENETNLLSLRFSNVFPISSTVDFINIITVSFLLLLLSSMYSWCILHIQGQQMKMSIFAISGAIFLLYTAPVLNKQTNKQKKESQTELKSVL